MTQYNVSEATYVFVFQYAKPKEYVKSVRQKLLITVIFRL
jgi:hypothetical protein